jgi:formylglycine-generating enzyme required for sulfatase activity
MPVDAFEPNPWGLYNVHGNIWDWTDDCRFESNADNPGDGTARTKPLDGSDCNHRIVRGGSWRGSPATLRAAHRGWFASGFGDDSVGFRLTRTLAP